MATTAPITQASWWWALAPDGVAYALEDALVKAPDSPLTVISTNDQAPASTKPFCALPHRKCGCFKFDLCAPQIGEKLIDFLSVPNSKLGSTEVFE